MRKTCQRKTEPGPVPAAVPAMSSPPTEKRLKTRSTAQQQTLAGVMGSSLDLLTGPVGGPTVVYKPANAQSNRLTHISLQTHDCVPVETNWVRDSRGSVSVWAFY